MFHCISHLKDQTLEGNKDCNFIFILFSPSLLEWRCPHVPVFFLSFVPNLLRKAVKVEGTQEGIVKKTKHGPEQLDIGYKNSLCGQFDPSFLILYLQ